MTEMSGGQEPSSEAGTPRRRLDDQSNSRLTLDMVRFLMTRPTMDQVAQQLVMNLAAAHRPRYALIGAIGSDGFLHLVGSFGAPAEALEDHRNLSLWSSSPMAGALRTGQPETLLTAEAARETYPNLLAEPHPAVVWPLRLPSQRVGALHLAFTDSVDSSALLFDLGGVVAVLALYLSLVDPPAEDKVEQPPAKPAAENLPLTERQLTILGLMAKGLTNPQIATRIGFSESTVRQETMAIYRRYGASGRREAVALAVMHGVLENNLPSPT